MATDQAGSAAYRSGSRWPFGFAESPERDWNQLRETTRWIGKPWRRIELLTHRTFWQGEEVGKDRTLQLHLGSRRLGLFVTLILGRSPGFDYSEEEHV